MSFILDIWMLYHFWSLLPVVIMFFFGGFLWKKVVTPRDYHERVAWKQTRENRISEQTKFRRIVMTSMILIFGLMASATFSFSFYMALK